MPEWYLLIVAFALLSLAGLLWRPLLWSIPALIAAAVPLLSQSVAAALHASLRWREGGRIAYWRQRARIAWLHLLQPIMRLRGRLSYGLHPLRRRPARRFAIPRPREHSQWSEEWRSAEARLEDLEGRLETLGARTIRGGPFDAWDLEIWGGLLGGVRVLMTIEEHGQGRQLIRVRWWPATQRWATVLATALLPLAAVALAFEGAGAATVLGGVAVLFATRAFFDCGVASRIALTGQLAPDANTPSAAQRPQVESEVVAP
jgi:hypothetical protein